MEVFCPKKCHKESVTIAKSYQRVCDSDFDDALYNKHVELRKSSFLTDNSISEIEHYVMITPKGKFRDIDVHKFDTKCTT